MLTMNDVYILNILKSLFVSYTSIKKIFFDQEKKNTGEIDALGLVYF